MQQSESSPGAVDSEQRVLAPNPVVDASEAGALRLGTVYWAEVERFTRRAVRVRASRDGFELRLFWRGPALLRFGAAATAVAAGTTRCAYPIRAGGLARRSGGEIAFAQQTGDEVELRSTIQGYHPTLAARPGAPRWAGALYSHGQRRLHLAISRGYFRRLIAEAGR
ncbi:MAG: hypothetical protein H0T39_10640 [Actinobacteria bacterium]|nr:hypothetical protein [Actinomycetota bacterium]